MVAYSFKKEFAAPIIAGTKRQTIRADRARHARVGETLQLFTGMRTKHCRKIGTATCAGIVPIWLDFDCDRVQVGSDTMLELPRLNAFAVRDGFKDFAAMRTFWENEHDLGKPWSGYMIQWTHFEMDQAYR